MASFDCSLRKIDGDGLGIVALWHCEYKAKYFGVGFGMLTAGEGTGRAVISEVGRLVAYGNVTQHSGEFGAQKQRVHKKMPTRSHRDCHHRTGSGGVP